MANRELRMKVTTKVDFVYATTYAKRRRETKDISNMRVTSNVNIDKEHIAYVETMIVQRYS